MKCTWALLLFWFISAQVNGQDASLVDQNLNEFQIAKSDSGQCRALIQACFNSSRVAPAAGVSYGKKAIKLAQAGKFEKLQADAHNSIGLCYDTYGKADSAMYHFYTSIKLLRKTGFNCETAAVYANIGNAQRRISKYTEALSSFTKAIEIQEECGDVANRGMALQSIGSTYNSLKNYEKAIEYFDLAIAMENVHGIESRLGPLYQSKANSYLGLKRLDEASRLAKMALQNYAKSGNEYNVAYTFESMAHIQLQLGNVDSAIYYSTKALNIFKGMNAMTDIVFEQIFLSELLLKVKDYETAKSKLLEILPVTISENLPHDRMRIMKTFSDLYADMGNYKLAYEYQFKQMALKDSLNIDARNAQMTALTSKFETDKRDKQIALEKAQNAQIKTESDRQKQQKYLLLLAVILLCLLIIVLINRYLQKKRSARELALVNVQIGKEKARAEQSEKMKQEFLSNMSHEIRTPVNAINGLSHLLLDREHDSRTREFLGAIHHSGQHLMVILNDILDVAKIEAGKLDILQKPMCLADELKIVRTIYNQKATEKNLDFSVYLDPSIPALLNGDASRLSQVLGNLVSNAIKFTEDGKVELRVENAGNSGIHFSVIDSGVGISAADENRIFESFEQIAYKYYKPRSGTGLGLTIARKLVRLMGGELKVKSEPGKGSIFQFYLRLMPTDPVSIKNPKIIASIIDTVLHIIVAEDNEYNFWVTQGYLEKLFPNSKIYRAKSGKDVLSLLDEDEYDLIIMDVQMPEMDGLRATQLLRKRGIDIPVLGLTASVLKEEQEKCIEAGMDDFVQKPFKEAELTDTLFKLLKIQSNPEMYIDTENQQIHSDQFVKWMSGRIIQFEEAYRMKDLEIIKSISHQMRPLIVKSMLKDLNLKLIKLENTNIWDSEAEQEIVEVISLIRAKLVEFTKISE